MHSYRSTPSQSQFWVRFRAPQAWILRKFACTSTIACVVLAPSTLTHPDANGLARPRPGQCAPKHPHAGFIRLSPRRKTPAAFVLSPRRKTPAALAAVRTEDLSPVARWKFAAAGSGDADTLAPHRRPSRAASICPVGLGLFCCGIRSGGGEPKRGVFKLGSALPYNIAE